MTKKAIGPRALLYPLPALLIGANVAGKPNFMTAAWGGVACSDPPMVTVAIQPRRYTIRGIRESSAFSVNIPSEPMARETDFCGISSGSRVDKVAACRFKLFYGQPGSAPMIEECPVNLECRVAQTLELGSHVLFIGRIVETYVSEDCMTDGRADVNKIKPMAYIAHPAAEYRALGELVGKAFSCGTEIKPPTNDASPAGGPPSP